MCLTKIIEPFLISSVWATRQSLSKKCITGTTTQRQQTQTLPISWDGVDVKIMSMSIHPSTSCTSSVFNISNLIT